MTVGTIVVVFFADSFLTPFTAFLTTLGVVIAVVQYFMSKPKKNKEVAK